MKFKIMSKIAAMVLIMGFAVSVNAQTESDAVAALKDGIAKYQAKDYLAAIKSFEKCVTIYDDLGLSASENRGTAASQITKTQYKYALSFYKQKKYDESIAEFEKLKKLSETYNDPEHTKKAELVIPQLYYFKGKALLDSKDYDGALTALNKSIELNPDYPNAHLRKAQLFDEQGDEANFKLAIDGALKASQEKKDSKAEEAAKQMAGNFYLRAGADAVTAEKWADAENYFKTLLNYKEADADIYYQFSVIYNKESKWDEAIEAGNKALKLMGEVDSKDAKVYYELGNAYYGKGDNDAACDAYSKANKGDYAEAAEYQIKNVVKCQ